MSFLAAPSLSRIIALRSLAAPSVSVAYPRMIVVAIVLLLVYQGYTLSIAGVAAPWIAKSFALDQASLARLFAWMSVSAFGSLLLARLAD